MYKTLLRLKNFIYICNMSLRLSISAEEQPNSFFVYDCTGSFSAENQGGWGGTNPKITDIQLAILTITAPNLHLPTHLTPGQVDTIVIPTPTTPIYTLSVNPNFPNATDDDQAYEVLPYMVGNNNNTIPSGKWRIQLDVSGTYGINNTPFKASCFVDKVFIKTVACCVDGLQKYVNVNSHEDKKSKSIIELSNLLFSAEKDIECGLLDTADGIIRLLSEGCACVDC